MSNENLLTELFKYIKQLDTADSDQPMEMRWFNPREYLMANLIEYVSRNDIVPLEAELENLNYKHKPLGSKQVSVPSINIWMGWSQPIQQLIFKYPIATEIWHRWKTIVTE